MDKRARSLVFKTLPNGCMVPTSHKTNSDGYFRKRWADGTIEMFHRFIWRVRRGEIPEGYEINHLCGNRACQNIDHLECIPGSLHASLTNRQRYAHIHEEARSTWRTSRCSATALSKKYGWAAYGWVRKWKKEDHHETH